MKLYQEPNEPLQVRSSSSVIPATKGVLNGLYNGMFKGVIGFFALPTTVRRINEEASNNLETILDGKKLNFVDDYIMMNHMPGFTQWGKITHYFSLSTYKKENLAQQMQPIYERELRIQKIFELPTRILTQGAMHLGTAYLLWQKISNFDASTAFDGQNAYGSAYITAHLISAVYEVVRQLKKIHPKAGKQAPARKSTASAT